jgi:hypothetical protein
VTKIKSAESKAEGFLDKFQQEGEIISVPIFDFQKKLSSKNGLEIIDGKLLKQKLCADF